MAAPLTSQLQLGQVDTHVGQVNMSPFSALLQ